jgi:hypothetical protein
VSFLELQTKLGEKGSSSPNLHSLWDTAMLERIAGIRRESHDADVKHFANELARRYAKQIARWKAAPVDIEGWAWESHQLAGSVAYGKLPAAVTAEAPVDVSSCADDNNIGQRMMDLHEQIGQSYVTAASPAIERQLARAGARLADVLNRAFDAKPDTSSTSRLGDPPPSPGVPSAVNH